MSSIQNAYLELLLKNDCKARSLFRQRRWGCTEEDSQFSEPVPYGCAIGKIFASKCGSETYIACMCIMMSNKKTRQKETNNTP